MRRMRAHAVLAQLDCTPVLLQVVSELDEPRAMAVLPLLLPNGTKPTAGADDVMVSRSHAATHT